MDTQQEVVDLEVDPTLNRHGRRKANWMNKNSDKLQKIQMDKLRQYFRRLTQFKKKGRHITEDKDKQKSNGNKDA